MCVSPTPIFVSDELQQHANKIASNKMVLYQSYGNHWEHELPKKVSLVIGKYVSLTAQSLMKPKISVGVYLGDCQAKNIAIVELNIALYERRRHNTR